MTLADDIEADVSTVIDPDDFADEITVDGLPVTAQLDSDRFAELSGYTQFALGSEATVIYAPADQMPERKRNGDILEVNGRPCQIISWEERGGIAEVSVQAAD